MLVVCTAVEFATPLLIIDLSLASLASFASGLAGFCQTVGKNVFSMVKTKLAKIVFASKNSFFLPEYIFIKIKFANFCLYLIE